MLKRLFCPDPFMHHISECGFNSIPGLLHSSLVGIQPWQVYPLWISLWILGILSCLILSVLVGNRALCDLAYYLSTHPDKTIYAIVLAICIILKSKSVTLRATSSASVWFSWSLPRSSDSSPEDLQLDYSSSFSSPLATRLLSHITVLAAVLLSTATGQH